MKLRCRKFLRSLKNECGVLSFEWILLITLVVIGIVGGLSAARDAIISELGDIVGAVVHIDQSYTVSSDATGWGNEFSYTDALPECAGEQNRPTTGRPDQGPVGDCSNP
jgi:Flp pilus assembly pilin Flp